MFRRDDDFHQTLIVLEHICDVKLNHKSNAGVLLPIFGRAIVNVQPSRPHYRNVPVDRLETGDEIWPISAW